MPKLLVSVRDSDEALAAMVGGADWIDLKEPSAGPLAAVDVAVAEATAQALAGRHTLSAALGELRDWVDSPAKGLLSVAGVQVVKLGLAGCQEVKHWQQQWLEVSEAADRVDKKLVAVIYADWQHAKAPSPDEVLALACAVGSRFLLIDTFDKNSGSVFEHLPPDELRKLLRKATHSGLTTVLAGSLSLDLIESLPSEAVDIIAVRGAVCRGDRTRRIDPELVQDFREHMTGRYLAS